MDLSLRGPEDGLAITRELRRHPRWKQIPILALTAHAFPDDRRRALAAGCDGYFSKPFAHRDLLETIEGLLRPNVPSLATGS
jgi:CheY-like chemotaxis protein